MTNLLANLDTTVTLPYKSTAANPLSIYLVKLATTSRVTMLGSARQVIDVMGLDVDPFTFPWDQLTPDRLVVLRKAIDERYTANTAARLLSFLRGVLTACNRVVVAGNDGSRRLVDHNDLGDRLAVLRGTSNPDVGSMGAAGLDDAIDRQHGRLVGSGEFRRILATCGDDHKGLRDRALLYVLFMGLRRTEVANLRSRGYNADDQTLTVVGKRGKVRTIGLPDDVAAAIDDWVTILQSFYFGSPAASGYLFPRLDKWGNFDPDINMTGHGVAYVMKSHAKLAGVDEVACHDFRRTTATTLIDEGNDLGVVADHLGHSSVDTTKRYDLSRRRRAVNVGRSLTVPT